jgi:hypothetical protein
MYPLREPPTEGNLNGWQVVGLSAHPRGATRFGARTGRKPEFIIFCIFGGGVRRWRRDRKMDGALSVGLNDPCRTNSTRAAVTKYRRPDIA